MLPSIQVLRGLAAWMVVAQHFFEHIAVAVSPDKSSITGAYAGVVFFGTLGVNLFFAISGIVMAKSVLERPQSPAEFMVNRIRRIVPAYWTWTIFAVILSIISLQVTGRQSFFISGQVSVMNILKSFLFIPFEPAGSVMTIPVPMLAVGWTLNFEMFFYVVLAATLFAPRDVSIIVVAILMFIFPFIWPEGNIFFPIASSERLTLFGSGLLIGFIRFRLGIAPKKILVLSIVAIATTRFPAPGTTLEIGFLLMTMPVLLVLSSISLEESFSGRSSRVKNAFLLLGDISYSTYLCHVVVMGLAVVIFGRPTTFPEIVGFTVGLIAAILAASVISFVVLERGTEKFFR